ncbi:MAG: cytidylate kinase family protein [Candidatus Methylomirabilales bacterium]
MKWITVSRKMGTNGAQIAGRVAQELGYRLYDTEAINQTGREMGVLESVQEVDEKAPSLFQRLFSQRPTVDYDRLYSVIYELAKRGDAVFLGRGSHILLKSFACALHVRITASPEKRVRTLMERGFNREAALAAMKRTDDERSSFIRAAFGVDWEDPDLYDLVLNMDKLSVDLAVATVVHLARSSEIADASADAVRLLETLGLSSRVEAALIEAGITSARGRGERVTALSSLTASVVEPGTVRLSGQVDTAERRAEAERVVRSVIGVQSVENDVRVLRPQAAV